MRDRFYGSDVFMNFDDSKKNIEYTNPHVLKKYIMMHVYIVVFCMFQWLFVL